MMRVLVAVLLVLGLQGGSATAAVEDQIKARIAPIGTVCVDGEDCGDILTSAAPASASASSGPRSGEEVYQSVCAACHNAGVAGAPVTGDAPAWSPRLEKGLDTLITHAIEGFNAMPAKGGCANCPDEEIQAAVEHMVEAVE
ncbi:c-type cytochrome [Marinobacter sp. JSM 1782161]|uniref:c-type cytochrome n=1 Tax=Marinobacter sp. JSM 1782161 TaxID=2685906 RepID=UPI001402D0F6|nr:c-type cytochrome [Marinobacter sp. JSM 1782161]